MSDWKCKDVWKRYGKDFMVEISRHEESADEGWESFCDAQGPHRWCVYAYIYPKHPHFANFDGDQMWQEAASCCRMSVGPAPWMRSICPAGWGIDLSSAMDGKTASSTANNFRALAASPSTFSPCLPSSARTLAALPKGAPFSISP